MKYTMHFIVCFLFNFNKDLNLKIDDADTSLTGLLLKKLGKKDKKVMYPQSFVQNEEIDTLSE